MTDNGPPWPRGEDYQPPARFSPLARGAVLTNWLVAGERFTIGQAADRLNVSRRTIQRDLIVLECRLPLAREAGLIRLMTDDDWL